MSFADDWKLLILQRWAGEYPPSKLSDLEIACPDVVLKSSQEIADDLREAGEFTADEVSAFLATRGYQIVFDAGYPKWKIQTGNSRLID